jgi:uncharacterized protein
MEKKTRVLDAYAKIETRKDEGGKMFIDGVIPYGSRSEEMWGFVEIIAPGAFKRTLDHGSDIFAFWAHDTTKILASRKGGTLVLEDKADGLHFSAELRETAVAADYFETVSRGDCSGVSFGFIAEVEEWDSKAVPAVRTLKEVRLLEISPGVAFPAYPGAQSDAARRSLYAEGASEFRTKFSQAPAAVEDIPSPEATPGPSEMAPETRYRLELDMLCAELNLPTS